MNQTDKFYLNQIERSICARGNNSYRIFNWMKACSDQNYCNKVLIIESPYKKVRESIRKILFLGETKLVGINNIYDVEKVYKMQKQCMYNILAECDRWTYPYYDNFSVVNVKSVNYSNLADIDIIEMWKYFNLQTL